jgi:hypothetical protein
VITVTLCVVTALPVTKPAVLMVATVVALLLHAPPEVRSVSCVVAPAHTARLPVIATGTGFTVTVVVIEQPASEI